MGFSGLVIFENEQAQSWFYAAALHLQLTTPAKSTPSHQRVEMKSDCPPTLSKFNLKKNFQEIHEGYVCECDQEGHVISQRAVENMVLFLQIFFL